MAEEEGNQLLRDPATTAPEATSVKVGRRAWQTDKQRLNAPLLSANCGSLAKIDGAIFRDRCVCELEQFNDTDRYPEVEQCARDNRKVVGAR